MPKKQVERHGGHKQKQKIKTKTNDSKQERTNNNEGAGVSPTSTEGKSDLFGGFSSGLQDTPLTNAQIPVVQRQNLLQEMYGFQSNQYMSGMFAPPIQRREPQEAEFDVDGAVAYNQSRFQYSPDLVEQLHHVVGDDTLYQAALQAGELGPEFAELVFVAQQTIFESAGDQDGKLGPTTFREVREVAGTASGAVGLGEEDTFFPEEQLNSSNYERMDIDGVGDFTATGGFMEPHGHSNKSEKQAIFSEDPDSITDLPASDRNLGVDYVVHDDGKPANSWYGGVVTHAGLDGGYGNRVTVETDVSYIYNGQEYNVTQAYGHLADIYVEEGQVVSHGEAVGQMGGTGSGGAVRYPEHVDLRTWIMVDGAQIDLSPNALDRQLAERAAEGESTEIPQPAPDTGSEGPAPEDSGTTPEDSGTTPAESTPGAETPVEDGLTANILMNDTTLAAVLQGNEYLTGGLQGPTVTKLQQALAAAGFWPGSIDGDYGDNTKQAVMAFQNAHSLGADGVVGKDTITALDNALSTAPEQEGGLWSPLLGSESEFIAVLAGTTYLQQGASGEAIVKLQQALNAAGFSTQGIDGDFGNNTKQAVIAFQTAAGLSADGIVGRDTVMALDERISTATREEEPVETPAEPAPETEPEPTPTPSPSPETEPETEPSPTPTPAPEPEPEIPATRSDRFDNDPILTQVAAGQETVELDDRGEHVRLLQQALTDAGLYLGGAGVDGHYGYMTHFAIRALQRDAGITEDGAVGKNTLEKLQYFAYDSRTLATLQFEMLNEDAELGRLSAIYETGSVIPMEGAGKVSSGVGDRGGVSYGSYQFPSLVGPRVIEFLNNEGAPFADQFIDPQTNQYYSLTQSQNSTFSEVWKQVAAENPREFYEAQHAFVQRTHFDVFASNIESDYGFDVSGRSKTLRDVLWSTSVQHGPNNSIFDRAVGGDPNTLSDEEIIQSIYAERGRTNASGVLVYFSGSSWDVQQGVRARFQREVQQALRFLQEERAMEQNAAEAGDYQPPVEAPVEIGEPVPEPVDDSEIAPPDEVPDETVETPIEEGPVEESPVEETPGGNETITELSERFQGDAALEAIINGQSTLEQGAEGETVSRIQQALLVMNYDLGRYGADGDFGGATKLAIQTLQDLSGLPATGIIDQATMATLSQLDPGPSAEDPRLAQVDIGFGGNVEGVTSHAINTLKQILVSAGLNGAFITSGLRTPYHQARVMYDNLQSYGVADQKALYGSYGDQVIDAYVAASSQHPGDRAAIIAAMEQKISEIGPTNVSKHCGDPHDLGVLDVSPGSVGNEGAFRQSLDAFTEQGSVSRYIPPPADPAYHIEIPYGGVTPYDSDRD